MNRLDALRKLYDADGADADVPYMIALEHAKLGETDAAVAWLDKALAADPSHHYAWYQKAKALAAAGRAREARAAADAGLARAAADGNAKALGELEALREELA